MGGSGVNFYVYRYDVGGESIAVDIGTINAGNTAVTFIPTVSGYYAVAYMWDGTGSPTLNTSNVSITVTCNNEGTSVFCHRQIANFENELPSMNALRVGGVSMKYAERASDLNTQGEIIGAQINGSYLWHNFISDGFDKATAQRQMKKMPIKNGFYAYIKPTNLEQLSYDHFPFVQDNNVMDGQCTYLDDPSPYLIFYARVISDPGKDAYVECHYGVEWLTNTDWRTYGIARYSPKLFEEAIWQLDNIDQFHENPTHFGEIWEDIKKVAKDTSDGLLDYGPKLFNLFKSFV
jgi:hypothetical protein